MAIHRGMAAKGWRLAALASALALAACVLPGCDRPVDGRPLVFVSVLPQKYLVERLAGDRVRVEAMVPPGASPATYEPGVAQVERLSRASLYLSVGHPNLPFERTWLMPLLADAKGVVVVDGSAGLPPDDGDPHIWVAPRAMERMAVVAEAALRALLPDDGELLADNLQSFRLEIDALDAEIRSQLSGLTHRSFLVFHPAWGHFARAYGLEQVAIEHEHKAPDPRRLGELIEQARRQGVRTVFIQPQFDPASAELLAGEIGARVAVLDPLAYDWPDNLRRVARALSEDSAG